MPTQTLNTTTLYPTPLFFTTINYTTEETTSLPCYDYFRLGRFHFTASSLTFISGLPTAIWRFHSTPHPLHFSSLLFSIHLLHASNLVPLESTEVK